MSERESEQGPVEGREPSAEPISTPTAEPPRTPPEPRRGRSHASPWLAGLLVLVLAIVALSPFWAPQLTPLLPWSEGRTEGAALEARLAAVEARPVVSPQESAREPAQELAATQSAISNLARRVGQLETALDAQRAEMEKRSAAPGADLQPIASALDALTQRVEHLETAVKSASQSEPAVAATRAGLQQVEQRLGALETQSGSRVADETAAAKDTEQHLAKLDRTDADLAQRLAALERKAQSQSASEIRTDGMLSLLLAQMREAVAQARPFPTEYNAFVKLARDPELAAAAQPLAEAARNGVPGRAVLEKRLSELAGAIAAPSQPQNGEDWRAQALARLRGLVTVRRIEGSPPTGPEAVVNDARAELARGDLAGAVDKLDHLTGASADAARPWLQMARQRLAVETALEHLEELLTVRLGGSPASPDKAPADKAPANLPEETDRARTRS